MRITGGVEPRYLDAMAGHSLGGALATLAALSLAERGLEVECVTFGSPKVGDEDFCRFFRSKVHRNARFVNKFDPVPRVPLGAGAWRDDADVLHQLISLVLKAPQERLACGDGYAHVCEAFQLDSGFISSLNHWKALLGALSADQRRAALLPHVAWPLSALPWRTKDLSIYREHLEGKQSCHFRFEAGP